MIVPKHVHRQAKPTVVRHVIEDVQYMHGQSSETAPLKCTCTWEGLAKDYPAHRKEATLR